MSCGKALVFKVYDSLKDGRALDRPYGVRGSDLAAQCQAARKHRDPDAGVFLIHLTWIEYCRDCKVPVG